MAEKFQNKYRISSARLQNWDYGTNGAYFISICTANRMDFFGEIVMNDDDNAETRLIVSLRSPTEQQAPTNKTGGFAGNKNPMFHESISRIIICYKGCCSFEMHKIHANFAWQTLFYDHIIRNSQSYENISNYIINNPAKWYDDKFYNK